MKYLVFILLICSLHTLAVANDFFSSISINDGLSQSTVKAITQDKYGYLWIGTGDGLNVFNGYHIKQFYNNPSDNNSITSNDITKLYTNPYDSVLYIGSENSGFSIYDRIKDRFISFKSGPIQQNLTHLGGINDFVATSTDSLWIATKQNGLFIFNNTDSTFSRPGFITNSETSFNNLTCLRVYNNNTLLIGTTDGLFWLDLKTDKVELLKINSPLNDNIHITKLITDLKGNIYIGTLNSGLFIYHPKSNTIRQYNTANSKPTLLSNSISDILLSTDGTLTIATDKGLSMLSIQSNTIKHYKHDSAIEESITDNTVLSLYKDDSEILWIGTFKGGLNKFNPVRNRFSKYNNFFSSSSSNTGFNNIYDISKDSHHSIWLNTSNGLLEIESDYFNERDTTYLTIQCEQTYGHVFHHNSLGLFYSNQDGIIRKASNGQFHDVSEQIFNQTGKRVHSFLTAKTDSDGTIWISTGLGLLKLEPTNLTYKLVKYKKEDELPEPKNITCIIENSTGYLLLGTSDGTLYKFDRYLNQLTLEYPLANTKQSSFSKIFSFIESKKKVIWLGTNTGLYQYDPELHQLKRHDDIVGYPNNTVYGILEDNNGKIWCSTNNGIFVYYPNEHRFQNFTFHDGLQSNEFNQSSFYKDSDGYFYMGGINGFNVFKPENIKINNHKPNIVIEEMQLLYEEVTNKTHPDILKSTLVNTSEITLSYEQSTFGFKYAALSYFQSVKNNYKYLLEGYDQKWINAGTRRLATYTNIPPGEYIFKVIGSNHDQVWSDKPAQIKITIKPPYWQTIWFRITLGLLLFAIMYSIIVLRIRIIRRQKKILSKRVHEKTEHLKQQKLKIENQNHELTKINNEITYKNHLLKEQHLKITKQHTDLKQLSNELKEANQSKLKFFTNITHEFLTPLTLITSPIQDILNNINTIDKSQLNKQLTTVSSNASRLMVLITQLLDFRKHETNNLSLDVSKFELVSFTQKIINLFQDLCKKRNISISISSTQPQIDIWADNLKFEIILLNLLSNSFKSMSDNGNINIEITQANDSETENNVTLSVSDNGCGIDEDLLPSIFNRFYQVKTSDKNNDIGNGLGLAIVKSFVELHKGDITVKSKVGHGTTFTIVLPISESTENKQKQPTQFCSNTHFYINRYNEYTADIAETNNAFDNTKDSEILIIEDNVSICNFLKDTLSKDYNIITSGSGEKGLELINLRQPDLIICDVMLPNMNGFDVCKNIKSQLKTKHIPFILLTALTNTEDQLTGLELGADDYIQKPFDLNILKQKIKNLIDYRMELQSEFLKVHFHQNDNAENEQGKTFIDEVVKIIEEQLTNKDFNVNVLCSKLEMSHSLAYRKINNVTNLTIQEFIRSIRLKKASELLLSNKYKINEIAYMVGYNDPNYFSRSFAQVYKKTPKQYIKHFASNKI
ncbi:hybrid sensor histidine kinase/response regulator transcription factor [Carboxylicivirga marina]|uniref:hybrid sensor histidine kinase/response regulator transcription factor n=1 Tax=Carboxylicivirga marina TaxID=2800988 RepID=UPI002591E6DD|nr:hybrid sensor histidine kinase/response regulator transcription factor [uncultured Carboxylicivirga sp.]